jgi:uncharacterized phage protein gp47/JayE
MIADLYYIDATGFHFSDYPTILAAYQSEYRLIYGTDVYLEADSQDGQWIAVNALALFDALSLAAATYNSFSPLTALGDALSRNVKLNGIRRRSATYSTADLRIVGQVGTEIINGVAEDTLGQKWNLPPSVVIPVGSEIVVTATAAEIGATAAAASTINKINTPTLGWQTVDNTLAATPGVSVETDAELRRRQTVSTALPSLSVLDGIKGAVANVSGVTRSRAYENDGSTTDADGLPAHSISLVVEGGATQDIGDAIARKKTPGTTTYGATSATTYDALGVPNVINFYRPTVVPIKVAVTVKALQGYTTGYAALIRQAVADAINALDIGEDVLLTKLYVPANLAGTMPGASFNITVLQVGKVSGSLGSADVVLAFNEVASCVPGAVTVTVTP